jgi:hypothetical protein
MGRAVLPSIRTVDRAEFTDYAQRKREQHSPRTGAGNAGLMGVKLAIEGKLRRSTLPAIVAVIAPLDGMPPSDSGIRNISASYFAARASRS